MRQPTPLSGALRLAMVGVLLGSAVLSGFWRRSPLAILALAVGFTMAYAGGKLPQWRRAWREHGVASLLGLPVTYAVQCVLVAGFYLVGLGFGTLFTERVWQPFSGFDVVLGITVGLAGLAIGPVLDRLEGVEG